MFEVRKSQNDSPVTVFHHSKPNFENLLEKKCFYSLNFFH